MEKKVLKELAKICRMLAKAYENMKYYEPKLVKKKCPKCGHKKTIIKHGKIKTIKKNIPDKFLLKAKIFEDLARREKNG